MSAPLKRRLQERIERANPVADVHFWESPPGAEVRLHLITHLEVYSAIHEHAMSALPNETGGFLLGRVALDSRRRVWLVEVEEYVPVEPLSQDPVHFSFTWRDVDRVRSQRAVADKALVGWCHTHPGLGIFLSETDLEKTHRVLFGEPFQIALVFDPVGRRAGYFFWEGAQTIDATQAPWREFEIVVAPEPPADADSPAIDDKQATPVTPAENPPGAAPDAAVVDRAVDGEDVP
jgi:proteasome lid subunit RPN8/RPN11